MLYTIYINISQSMLYYDGVKKTFFLPHIFKKSDGRVNLPSLFFCADSDENIQEEVTAMLAWLGLVLVYSRSVATMPERSSGI